jgi:hypothetical protein
MLCDTVRVSMFLSRWFCHPDDGGDMFLWTTVFTWATRRHIQNDGILHSRRREYLRSYRALYGWCLAEKWFVSCEVWTWFLYPMRRHSSESPPSTPQNLNISPQFGEKQDRENFSRLTPNLGYHISIVQTGYSTGSGCLCMVVSVVSFVNHSSVMETRLWVTSQVPWSSCICTTTKYLSIFFKGSRNTEIFYVKLGRFPAEIRNIPPIIEVTN